MIIHPKVRGFICTTAHPVGCARHIQEQIDYVRSKNSIQNGPKNVLVIGSSTGYGLASRIVAAFGGSKASTIGVFYEKEAEGKRTATAGYYNTAGFEQKAHAEGLYAKSFNGDAFSDEIKAQVVETIKKDLGKIDLIVYSLASPRREHPKTKEVFKSVLKPLEGDYTNKSIDLSTNKLEIVTLNKAVEEEVRHTIAVMGGEDWEFWIDALDKAGVLAQGVTTVAYSYVGPEVTRPIYRNGTIGKAKDHLEETSRKLDQRLKKINGKAFISVNKALVTQSSSAIPFIPLYYILLSKVMKGLKIDEGCIEQIYRLFSTNLYAKNPSGFDSNGFIRMDDLELRDDVQAEVQKRWEKVSDENLSSISDIDGYHKDFLKLFGFGFSDVNYDADVDPFIKIPSLS